MIEARIKITEEVENWAKTAKMYLGCINTKKASKAHKGEMQILDAITMAQLKITNLEEK